MNAIEVAPPSSRFATIQDALRRQKRYLRRAHRRWSALLPRRRFEASTSAADLVAGVKALRLLQEILQRSDAIAIDQEEGGRAWPNVHLLLSLPAHLLDEATALAAHDEDDEETGDNEPDVDDEPDEEGGPSLGSSENMSQTEGLYTSGYLGSPVDVECDLSSLDGMIDQRRCSEGRDGERDTADDEPSLGSLGASVANFDQERWAGGDRLDREPSIGQVNGGVVDGEGELVGSDARDMAIRAKLRNDGGRAPAQTFPQLRKSPSPQLRLYSMSNADSVRPRQANHRAPRRAHRGAQ